MFLFDEHTERLAATARSMVAQAPDARPAEEAPPLPSLPSLPRGDGPSAAALADGLAPQLTYEALRPQLEASFRAGLAQLRHDDAGFDGELKATWLLEWGEAGSGHGGGGTAAAGGDDSPLQLHMHLAPLLPRRAPPIACLIHGAPRENAEAKDSEWVGARQGLEELKELPGPGGALAVEEVLLIESDTGAVLEGTQTNFYAVKDGAVHTADAGVLKGTVRALVLEVCEAEGIPVVLEPPNVSDLPRWEGAFLTSTSRLVLPIDAVATAADPLATRRDFAYAPGDASCVVPRVERLVAEAAAGRAVRIA